jgi:4-amino-4-deoxy-L-arabinose transferase-like glycosyltransferase
MRIAAVFAGTTDPWDWWQTIPTGDLLARPWHSLWIDHAQPPGFSLWGLAWLSMFGPQHFVAAMQWGYMALGAAVCAMTWDLARLLTGSRGWALAAGLAMALNPSLLLYEAYPLYELPTVFLMVAGAWCLGRGLAGGRLRWLAALALALNALVMTRSMFHWVFLIGALAFAWPLWRRMRPGPRVAWCLLALALPGAWYAKNDVQYGFFGPSSWTGMNWFKSVFRGFTYRELLDFKNEGLIPDYVQARYPFQHAPSQYREFGFAVTSDEPLLARDDFHNINIPAISRGYMQAGAALVARHPWRYAKAIHMSYERFCVPPSRFGHLDALRRGHVFWEPVVAQWLYGAGLSDEIERSTRIDLGSLFYIYFPILMLGGAWWVWRRRGARGMTDAKGVTGAGGRALLMAYLLYGCLYVAAVGCLFEYGENMRFRFASEPLTLIIACALIQWGVGHWRTRRSALRDNPASADG